MQSMWDEQQQVWLDVMQHLPIRKMPHSTFSEQYENLQKYKQKVVNLLETVSGQKAAVWRGLHKCWMPLPNVVLAFPDFRYVPFMIR